METKDRIRQIMEDLHMSQQVFADFIQQSPATLSSIFNGRTRPTLNIVEAIKAKIPDISVEWLLFGTGDMRVSHPAQETENNPAATEGYHEPMLQFDSPVAPLPANAQQGVPVGAFPNAPRGHRQEVVREEIKVIEKEPRRVTEIRVYYDDQTYETFVPSKK